VPPVIDTSDYSVENAHIAASILYKSPLPSANDLPVYILNSAAFPDSSDVNYDALLPYVLSRLPSDEQLIGGKGYEIVFFAGGEDLPTGCSKKGRPGWGWFLQAYHVLSRAMRKRLQKLYLVHERRWVRVMSEMFSTIVSPKFRRKVVHVSSLSALALHIPIEDLLIPPSAYDRDRKLTPEIYVPYASGRRAYGARQPLPTGSDGNLRLPRVLRETSRFVLMEPNVRTEGIFRVNSRAITTEYLKEAYDRGQKFILWKDPPAVMAPTHFKEGFGDVRIDEVDPMDGYSVPTATGLIKTWYASLREPLFPHSTYALLTRVYGSNNEIAVTTFLDLVQQSADWSPLTRSAKHVMTMHLFPLLSRVAAHQEHNKMSPRNLATCFAPNLLCGPDPLEDVKMSAVITRILEFGISHWKDEIAPKCSMDGEMFEKMLETPKDPADREDPLESGRSASRSRETHGRFDSGGEQMHGITMLENDSSDTEESAEVPHPIDTASAGQTTGTTMVYSPTHAGSDHDNDMQPPPLPPRTATGTYIGPASGSTTGSAPASPLPPGVTANTYTHPFSQHPPTTEEEPRSATRPTTTPSTSSSNVKRKPAPPVQNPPRYSTLTIGPDHHPTHPESFSGYGVGSLPGMDERDSDSASFLSGVSYQTAMDNVGQDLVESGVGTLIDFGDHDSNNGGHDLPGYAESEEHGGVGKTDRTVEKEKSNVSGDEVASTTAATAPDGLNTGVSESTITDAPSVVTETAAQPDTEAAKIGSLGIEQGMRGLPILRKPVGGSGNASSEASPVVGKGPETEHQGGETELSSLDVKGLKDI
jgi:Rho GTPase-activating protein 1